MSELSPDIVTRIQTTAQQVQQMETQLRSILADVQKLPFLARGFVERDISQSTGRSLAEWAASSQKMHQILNRTAQSGSAGAAALVTHINAELPKLVTLRTYLQKAPEKVKAVPAAVLKPQQRTHFLDEVTVQVGQLQQLEQQLQAIVSGLQS